MRISSQGDFASPPYSLYISGITGPFFQNFVSAMMALFASVERFLVLLARLFPPNLTSVSRIRASVKKFPL